MDSNFSRIFIEIASCSNITKAAENLGILKRGVCKVEVKVLSLPNRYLAKTKQVTKPIVPKAVADINSQIDAELANLNVKPHVFPQARMDSIEDLISSTIR